jgi:hypothetical protein
MNVLPMLPRKNSCRNLQSPLRLAARICGTRGGGGPRWLGVALQGRGGRAWRWGRRLGQGPGPGSLCPQVRAPGPRRLCCRPPPPPRPPAHLCAGVVLAVAQVQPPGPAEVVRVHQLVGHRALQVLVVLELVVAQQHLRGGVEGAGGWRAGGGRRSRRRLRGRGGAWRALRISLTPSSVLKPPCISALHSTTWKKLRPTPQPPCGGNAAGARQPAGPAQAAGARPPPPPPPDGEPGGSGTGAHGVGLSRAVPTAHQLHALQEVLDRLVALQHLVQHLLCLLLCEVHKVLLRAVALLHVVHAAAAGCGRLSGAAGARLLRRGLLLLAAAAAHAVCAGWGFAEQPHAAARHGARSWTGYFERGARCPQQGSASMGRWGASMGNAGAAGGLQWWHSLLTACCSCCPASPHRPNPAFLPIRARNTPAQPERKDNCGIAPPPLLGGQQRPR